MVGVSIHQNKRFVLAITGTATLLVLLFAVFVSGVLAFWLDPEPEQDTRFGTGSQASEIMNTSFTIEN